MRITVITDEVLKDELLSSNSGADNIEWQEHPSVSADQKSDVVIDLLFVNDPSRIAMLKQISPGLVIINSVADTLPETDPSFARINGWPTLLRSTLVETSVMDDKLKSSVTETLAIFRKQPEWLLDEPGFVTAKIISQIINEAYLALEEGVSTKADIDKAMKLGTNYPFGPFEWGEKIGLEKICDLLQKLSQKNPAYRPSQLLAQTAIPA